MVLGDAISKLERRLYGFGTMLHGPSDLAIIQLKNTKLGQMTNFKVIFHMMVLFYKFDKIGNSTQSPAQPQSSQSPKEGLILRLPEERGKISGWVSLAF